MPPSRWYTSSTPASLRYAVDFSQRIPPVQNMATLGFLPASMLVSHQAGNSRKVRMFGFTAFWNVPISTS